MSVGIAKQTARNRLQAEDAGEIRIHESDDCEDRVIAQLHAQIAATVEAHGFDAPGMVAHVHPIRSGYACRSVPAIRPVRGQNSELVGMLVGQGSEQDRFNHGKDGGVCPDAQRQSQRRRRCEYLVLQQLAPSEAQVCEEASSGVLPSVRIHPLFSDRHRAAFHPCGPPGVLSREAA